MYHREVLGLARTWLRKCTCVNGRCFEHQDYPTRLINLAALKTIGTIDYWKYHAASGPDDQQDGIVNLVETADLDWSRLENKAYVTLSHRWGGTEKPAKLTKETKETYEHGVRLASLPRTFQDASKQILFNLFSFLLGIFAAMILGRLLL